MAIPTLAQVVEQQFRILRELREIKSLLVDQDEPTELCPHCGGNKYEATGTGTAPGRLTCLSPACGKSWRHDG